MALRPIPEERLRLQLAKLGIPCDQHDLRSMQGMVPALRAAVQGDRN